MTTRSQNALLTNVLKPSIGRDTRPKRKAEASPPKEKTIKRSAFTNITNVCITNVILLDINIYAIFIYHSIVTFLYYFLHALYTIFLSILCILYYYFLYALFTIYYHLSFFFLLLGFNRPLVHHWEDRIMHQKKQLLL